MRLEPGAACGGHRPEGVPPCGEDMSPAREGLPPPAAACGPSPPALPWPAWTARAGTGPGDRGEVAPGRRRKRSDPRPWEGASSCGRPRTHFRSAESGPAARGSLTPGEGRPEAADPGGDSSRLPRASWAATESREADADVHKAGCPRPIREAARPGLCSYRHSSCWVTDLCLAPLTCGPCAPRSPHAAVCFQGSLHKWLSLSLGVRVEWGALSTQSS